jgi:hypothetical protein
MTDAADLLIRNAEVHTLTDPDETHEAVAVSDGRIVRVGKTYELDFLHGVETTVVDLDGRVLLPGFVDAHTHVVNVGRSLVHADLSAADSLADALDRLRARAAEVGPDEWVLGFGYDESAWDESRYLTREDLDAVAADRPVVALREDVHTASVNSAVLDRFADELAGSDDVHREGGDPTGVLVEGAVGVVTGAIEPGVEETRDLVTAAQRYANERGVTAVHDMVRNSHAPRVYRELDLAGELTMRVRINYWSDHLDSLVDAGLRTNHGSEMVQTGAIKSFTDGSFGGRTAKVSAPYADGEGTGRWVVDPDELRELVTEADDAGFQLAVHAIGDEAVDETLDAFEACEEPGERRHRIEHAELASDEAIGRFADLGVVASMQPNFLKWAAPGGLYDARLGDRRGETNRFPAYLDAGAPLAFGSDCMPLDPLLGVHHAVNAPDERQALSVTEALRAYTRGAAYAGFDEDRLGTVEVGKRADLVALDRSPWESPGGIDEIDVALTVVDGDIVYEGR